MVFAKSQYINIVYTKNPTSFKRCYSYLDAGVFTALAMKTSGDN